MFQIITVPPDKEKFQYSHNNNSPTGNVHLTVFLIILYSVQFPHLWLLSDFIRFALYLFLTHADQFYHEVSRYGCIF